LSHPRVSLPEGREITGEIKIDVTRDVPAADVDLRIANLKLGKFARKTRARATDGDDSGSPAPVLLAMPRVSLAVLLVLLAMPRAPLVPLAVPGVPPPMPRQTIPRRWTARCRRASL